jgi:hypothetical protein
VSAHNLVSIQCHLLKGILCWKKIEIAIGIAIEIENNDNTSMFDPDPDSDFDPENTFEKHQNLKSMTFSVHPQIAFSSPFQGERSGEGWSIAGSTLTLKGEGINGMDTNYSPAAAGGHT